MQNAVSILRELWRRPRLEVAALALVALVIGWLVAYQPSLPPKSRQYLVGTSSVRILIDTADSRVVAIAPPDQPTAGENLGGHASLLAQLLSQGDAKAAVARHAGVAPDKLIMIAPTEPGQEAESPVRHSRTADVLVVHTLNDDSGEPLPIIGIDAQAADGERAARLASAAVAGLQGYLKSKYAANGVPPGRQLRVRALSVPQGRDVTRGPGTTLGIGVAILVFGLLCALLLIVLAIARHWRAAWVAEQQLAQNVRSSVDPGDAAQASPAGLRPGSPRRRASERCLQSRLPSPRRTRRTGERKPPRRDPAAGCGTGSLPPERRRAYRWTRSRRCPAASCSSSRPLA